MRLYAFRQEQNLWNAQRRQSEHGRTAPHSVSDDDPMAVESNPKSFEKKKKRLITWRVTPCTHMTINDLCPQRCGSDPSRKSRLMTGLPGNLGDGRPPTVPPGSWAAHSCGPMGTTCGRDGRGSGRTPTPQVDQSQRKVPASADSTVTQWSKAAPTVDRSKGRRHRHKRVLITERFDNHWNWTRLAAIDTRSSGLQATSLHFHGRHGLIAAVVLNPGAYKIELPNLQRRIIEFILLPWCRGARALEHIPPVRNVLRQRV